MNRLRKKYIIIILHIILFFNVKAQDNNFAQTIDSLQQIISATTDDSLKADTYLSLLEFYNPDDTNYTQALDQALYYARQSGSPKLIATAMYSKAVAYNYFSKYDSAIVFFDSLITIFEEYNDTIFLIRSWGEKGNAYCYQAIYDKCLDCFLKSLEYSKFLKDKKYQCITEANIGKVYYNLEKIQDALKYFKSSYSLSKQTDFYYGIALSSNNISKIYFDAGDLDSAYFYIKICEESSKKINYTVQLAEAYESISKIFIAKKKYTEALNYSKKAVEYYKKLNSAYGLSKAYWVMGTTFYHLKSFHKAQLYLDSAMTIAKASNLTEAIREIYLWKFRIDSTQGNFKSALDNYMTLTKLIDSLNSKDVEEQIANLQSTFDLKQQEQENALLKAKQAEQQAEIARQRIMTIFSLIIVFSFLLLIMVLLFFYRKQKKFNSELNLKNAQIIQQKEEILTQNETLKQQNEEIETQKTILETFNKNITDSINYAKRIQVASLPDLTSLKNIFSDVMLLYIPKDIVSGDFYYYKKISETKTVVIVGDCTGHGVPGALMSIMNISLLNEILRQNKNLTSADILEKARELIKITLKQNLETSSALEGMDASVIIYDQKNKQINYAGANLSIFVITKDKKLLIKPDRQPVATYFKERKFTNHYFDVSKDDLIYMYTDGYYDQISNNMTKKFMLKNLTNLLIEIKNLPLSEQKKKLLQAYETHRGSFKQIDDITILGLKI